MIIDNTILMLGMKIKFIYFFTSSAMQDIFTSSGWLCFVAGKWMLISLVLNVIYKSELKARLIKPKIEYPFKNVEEFVKTDLPLWISQGSQLENIIQVLYFCTVNNN